MWINADVIHQPKPRTASKYLFRFVLLALLLIVALPNLLTHLIPTGPAFGFIRPPDPTLSLPTPSNTPPPNANAKGTHLTIPELVESYDHFESSDTLGRALDALAHRSSQDAVLTLEREEEGEYILSTRPFDSGAHKMACEELWSELDRLEEPVPTPARVQPPQINTAQPSAFSYLTPPSSPERKPKHH
jgi:hypothetical protein